MRPRACARSGRLPRLGPHVLSLGAPRRVLVWTPFLAAVVLGCLLTWRRHPWHLAGARAYAPLTAASRPVRRALPVRRDVEASRAGADRGASWRDAREEAGWLASGAAYLARRRLQGERFTHLQSFGPGSKEGLPGNRKISLKFQDENAEKGLDGEDIKNTSREPQAAAIQEGATVAALEHTSTTPILDRLNESLEGGFGSVLLLAAAAASMALANSRATAAPWLALWCISLGPAIGPGAHVLSLRGWVNEGLMCLFFFYVGLEIKKELAEGSLASPRKALLPCIAALGGMVVPMLVYSAINATMPGGSLAGLTIPMATDIAFAMGVFGLFRRYMPATAEPFLLTLATVDDLGAILVIAVCFAGHLAPPYLIAAAASLGAAIIWGRRGIRDSSRGILLPGLALWYCLLRGGLNADIAGFLAAMCVPMRSTSGQDVVKKLIKRWAPACGLLILPLFALANCAVPLGGAIDALQHRAFAVPAGVGLGLLLGKPLGIFSFSYLAVKSGLTAMPPGMSKRHLLTIGTLGAMGFTMCLFLIENSLTGHVAEVTKVAMLLGSLAGAGISAVLMRTSNRPSDESSREGGHAAPAAFA